MPPDRIRKCGGFVAWNSLGQPHVNGRLAMTRSIGDLDLKNSGVIAQPETKRVQVKESLVYRDGNWIKGATKLSEAGGGTHTVCSGETTRPSFGFHLW